MKKTVNSKFKHMFGKDAQSVECFNDVRLGSSINPDSDVLSVNAKFLAYPAVDVGTVVVQPLTKTGAVYFEGMPLIVHEDANAVNHCALSPFKVNQLATATNEKRICVWDFPEDGLTESISSPVAALEGHNSRALFVGYHPFVSDVLVSFAGDKELIVWDVAAQAAKLRLPGHHKQMITDVSWNGDGSLFATSAKDKTLRIFDPRAQTKAAEAAAHDTPKTSRSAWCGKLDRIVSVGFNRESYREAKLFDPRNLGAALNTLKMDVSSSPVMPLFDNDTGVLYLAGKGDGNVKICEVAEGAVTLLTEYKSKLPQTGIAAYPKRHLRVMDIEVGRVYRLTNNSVLPVSFHLDRVNKDFFQDDLFPPTYDGVPTSDAAGWFGGANNAPNTVSMEPSK